MVRSYARSPMRLSDRESVQTLAPTVAYAVADSLIAAGTHMLNLSKDGLSVMDDFGLTTAAATLPDVRTGATFIPHRAAAPARAVAVNGHLQSPLGKLDTHARDSWPSQRQVRPDQCPQIPPSPTLPRGLQPS